MREATFTVFWSAVPVGRNDHCLDDEPDCEGSFPHIDPDSGLSVLPLELWVIVTGHLRDPAAELHGRRPTRRCRRG